MVATFLALAMAFTLQGTQPKPTVSQEFECNFSLVVV